MRIPLGIALALVLCNCLAVPPTDHPAVGHGAEHVIQNDVPVEQLPHQAKVLDAAHVGEYSFIRVEEGDKIFWLAAPAMKVRIGNTVRFEDGAVMADFYSRSLKRTFSSIMFVGQIAVTSED